MRSQFRLHNGVMHCERVPLPLIAEQVGTPAYVYSTASMRNQVLALREALAPTGEPLIAYAVKANPNAAILTTFAAEGLGADVVSIGEYVRARAAGIAPEKIVFSGVGKTADEMAAALDGGLYQFNIESAEEAEMLSQVAQAADKRAPAAIRINPDVEAGSHPKISTGAARNKFGISMAEALDIFGRLDAFPGLDLRGVAVHIGSQLTNLSVLETAFTKIGDLVSGLRDRGHEIATVDLGGGLGINYDPRDALAPSPADYGAMIRRVSACWGVRLIVEPGRLLVGSAGVLLTRVIRVKAGAVHPFVVLDAGMNDLMRPALYDAWHAINAVNPTGQQMTADIVGPVCETGDTFALGRIIDQVDAGSLVVIGQAGAYAATMASSYNSRPLISEVMINGEDWAIVRERETIQSYLVTPPLPPWLR
ncbi:diaminopimelate decarboxylase [Allopontixanthobacter sediminis]|nr:diaminopimelate decarboxylase [Allopontixanthobacter sediminis]